MKKLYSLLVVLLMLTTVKAGAQIVYETTPWPLYDNSTDVSIVFHADLQSISDLKNQSELYAHIGVYTNKSPNTWKYTKTNWGTNTNETKFVRQGSTNDYKLTIGNLRNYFGITDASEVITSLNLVVRNSASTKKTDDQFFTVEAAPATPTATQENYPGGVPKQGTVKNADGTVTFCLAAPNKSNVTLVGSWDNYQVLAKNAMKYQDYNGFRYFWTTVSGLDNTSWYPYYYLVDGTYSVSDPYGKLMLDPYNDKYLNKSDIWPDMPTHPGGSLSNIVLSAYKGDMDDTYTWNDAGFTPAPRGSLTIYELLVRDFTGDEDQANGNGTLRKAIAKIPYLKELGITAVELLPVMDFDGNDSWGYAPNSYMSVDKAYGSHYDLKEFVDLCHQNGIAVIMDMVFNHATGLHPWYQMYEEGNNPFFNSTAPHNYSVYNDIRQEYGMWEPFFKDVLTHWITKFHIDGFRFDLVKGMGDNSSYNNNYDGNNENSTIVNRMKRIHAHMKSLNPNILHINEFFGHHNDEVALGNDGQMVWRHSKDNAQGYADGWCKNLKWTNWYVNSFPEFGSVDYVESHDEQWLGYVVKNSGNTNISGSLTSRMNRLGSIAAQLLMSFGPKMIWEFGELGYDEHLEEVGIARLDKKKVHWDYYNDPTRKTLFSTYQNIIGLRNLNSDLFGADVKPIYENFSDDETGRTIRLLKNNKEVVCFINPSSTKSMTVTSYVAQLDPSKCQVVTASADFIPAPSKSGNYVSVSVPMNSFCILATPAVATLANPEGQQAEWYLVGSAIDGGNKCWTDNNKFKFTKSGDNTYTLSLESISGEIKVKEAGEWTNTAMGSNGDKLQANVSYQSWTGTDKQNIEIDGTITNATITINTQLNTILIAGTTGGSTTPDPDPTPDPEPDPEPTGSVVYFENTSNWSGTIKAWVWTSSTNYTGGNWPGQECTYIGGNVWKWEYNGTLPEGTNIIFNNKDDKNNSQTGTFNFVNNGYYNGSGSVKTLTSRDVISVGIAGAVNNWSTTANATSTIVDNCGIVIVDNWSNTKSGQDSGFKVIVKNNVNNNTSWYGGVNPTNSGVWYKPGSGDNMTLPASCEGKTIKFTIAADNGSFTYDIIENVTEPDPDPTLTTYTMSYDNGKSAWTDVYVYLWKDSKVNAAYPGVKMTAPTGNSTVWTYTVALAWEPENVIFNNGSGKKTADLEFVDGKQYGEAADAPTSYELYGSFASETWIGVPMTSYLGQNNVELWAYNDYNITNEEAYLLVRSNEGEYFGAINDADALVTKVPCNIQLTSDNTKKNIFIGSGRYNFCYDPSRKLLSIADYTTSVEDIMTEEGEVEWYNLQGMRVVNPEKGLYIRRTATSVTKVYVK